MTEICGWAGMAMIIIAYFLVSNKKLDPVGKTYQWLNLLGSLGVGANVYAKEAWPALVLQVVWGLIALAALIRPVKEGSRG